MAKKINKELTFIITFIGITIVGMTIMTMKACSGGSEKKTGWSLSSLFGGNNDEEKAKRDSAIINSIHIHSRLYTAETTSHKTITYTSQNKFKVKIAGFEKDIKLPLTKTEATIPVNVTYKAFIDLDKITMKDIEIKGDTAIYITLPDPVIEQTAVSIDHENEQLKKQWLSKGLKYDEYQALIRKAKDEAWDELSEDNQAEIIETAKVSATDLIIPQLRSLGFKTIKVDYRQEFTLQDLIRIKR